MQKVKNAQEAMQNELYKETLVELLYQLADDDFILSFRGSEWLGLAPHIEEDVAFSSINQNMMGHAFMYYQLLEDLGEGSADFLAHGRPAKERKNAIILEEVNGSGTYLHEPKFDWAFTVVRHYFYDCYKKIKLEAMKHSSYEPLAHAAVNISKEQIYHLMHWDTWFKQLVQAGGEAKTRMVMAIDKVWNDFDGVCSFGSSYEKIEQFKLVAGEKELRNQFVEYMNHLFESIGLSTRSAPRMKRGNGRNGEHTEDLENALETLSEVYRTDTEAVW